LICDFGSMPRHARIGRLETGGPPMRRQFCAGDPFVLVGATRMCPICADERSFWGVGPCGHREVCWVCILRQRRLVEEPICPLCREPARKICIASTNLVDSGKSFASLEQCKLESRHLPDLKFQSSDVLAAAEALVEYRCWFASCVGRPECSFRRIQLLVQHVQQRHQQRLCEICLVGRKVFLPEQFCYGKKEFHNHEYYGDCNENPPIDPHPWCQFCNCGFFASDDLNKHMHSEHVQCMVCYKLGKPREYYFDNEELVAHYQQAHFFCSACGTQGSYEVFADRDELNIHELQMHPELHRGLSRNQLREKRTLNWHGGQPQRPAEPVLGDMAQFRSVRSRRGKKRTTLATMLAEVYPVRLSGADDVGSSLCEAPQWSDAGCAAAPSTSDTAGEEVAVVEEDVAVEEQQPPEMRREAEILSLIQARLPRRILEVDGLTAQEQRARNKDFKHLLTSVLKGDEAFSQFKNASAEWRQSMSASAGGNLDRRASQEYSRMAVELFASQSLEVDRAVHVLCELVSLLPDRALRTELVASLAALNREYEAQQVGDSRLKLEAARRTAGLHGVATQRAEPAAPAEPQFNPPARSQRNGERQTNYAEAALRICEQAYPHCEPHLSVSAARLRDLEVMLAEIEEHDKRELLSLGVLCRAGGRGRPFVEERTVGSIRGAIQSGAHWPSRFSEVLRRLRPEERCWLHLVLQICAGERSCTFSRVPEPESNPGVPVLETSAPSSPTDASAAPVCEEGPSSVPVLSRAWMSRGQAAAPTDEDFPEVAQTVAAPRPKASPDRTRPSPKAASTQSSADHFPSLGCVVRTDRQHRVPTSLAASTANQWACSACTFLNDSDEIYCGICGGEQFPDVPIQSKKKKGKAVDIRSLLR